MCDSEEALDPVAAPSKVESKQSACSRGVVDEDQAARAKQSRKVAKQKERAQAKARHEMEKLLVTPGPRTLQHLADMTDDAILQPEQGFASLDAVCMAVSEYNAKHRKVTWSFALICAVAGGKHRKRLADRGVQEPVTILQGQWGVPPQWHTNQTRVPTTWSMGHALLCC